MRNTDPAAGPAAPQVPGARGRLRAGMTLIELLLVMGLLAVLLGFGIGAIANLEIGTLGSASLVRSTLRSANNWAIARQAPARARLDYRTGRIAAEGLAVVGTWHFETVPPKGAFGLDGQLAGAELTDDGFIGKALYLSEHVPGAAYEIPVHTDPAFDLSTGFQLQLALRPDEARRGRVLQLGNSVRLEVTDKYGLVVTVSTMRIEEGTGERIPAGKAVLTTPDEVLVPERWNRILVSYDRTRFSALVEGVEVAYLAEEGYVAPVTSMLVIGGGQRPWSGSVDNLVISAVGAQEEVFLPTGCEFPKGTIPEIVFNPGGGLDRTIHPGPVEVEVEFEDGRRETVRVNLYGTVE